MKYLKLFQKISILLSFLFLFFCVVTENIIFAENEHYSCDTPPNNKYYRKFKIYLSYPDSDFFSAFEKLKKEYHSEINDEFNKAVLDLSKSVYSVEKSDVKACTPIHYKQQDNKSLSNFSREMQKKFWAYECTLSYLAEEKNLKIETKDINPTFTTALSSLKTQEFILFDEIERSGLALKMALQTYSEMRQWYPVHRDLECLISQMEKYRNALRGFIDRVVLMPAKFYNYSSQKQQD